MTAALAEAAVPALALLAATAAVRAVAGHSPARRRAIEALRPVAVRPSRTSGRRPRKAALGALGWWLPGLAAGLRARASERALHAALPETADLLAVSMNAGLNVALALRRAALHAPEPARSELDRTNREIALGRPLREALGALANRTGSDEVRALVSILAGTGRYGSRVAASIERWADDLWTRRRHELEADARRAPVRILFPLVFLILPAFLLTTVVPLLLSTIRTLGYGP
jgi:tight adherence protein C